MIKNVWLVTLLLSNMLLAQVSVSKQETQKSVTVNSDSSQQIADLIVQSKLPVLVDFWAPWCGPCRYLTPVIKELEDEYKNKVLFLKVNVDIHKAIAAYFKIMAIPSVFIIYDKTVVQNLQGVQPKDTYVNALEDVIKKSKEKPVQIPSPAPEK